jgi:hypothetical protein
MRRGGDALTRGPNGGRPDRAELLARPTPPVGGCPPLPVIAMLERVSAAGGLFVALMSVGLLALVAAPATPGPELGRAGALWGGCTVVYVADGEAALGGNNEDFTNALTRIWFIPGEDGGYGSVFVGYHDLVTQGGMNEAGLFFDGLGVREVEVPARSGKPTYTGQNMLVDVMARCESVACVIERYEAVSMPGTWNGQLLFGDRFGDSAIIEPLAIIPKSGHFQVATNFFQSEVPPAQRTDDRYVTATAMLAEASAVSVDLVRDVMQATHQEGTVNTVYSTVYDLGAQVIHLYYFNDFSTEVTFDLQTELAKGIHAYDIGELFAGNLVGHIHEAPLRRQLAARIDQLPQATVTSDQLVRLSGTYEARPHLTVIVATDGDTLLARQPSTPWVALTPVSESEFVRLLWSPGGALHDVRLAFRGGDAAAAASVDVSDDAGNVVSAMRTPQAEAPSALLPAIVLVVGLAFAAVLWRGRRRLGVSNRTYGTRPLLHEH